MSSRPQSTAGVRLRYGVAIGSVLLASVLRGLIDPYLGDTVPFVTYFAAIAASGWYGRFWPAVHATLLGCGAALWWFIPPRGSFRIPDADVAVTALSFLAVGLLISGALESMHRYGAARVAADDDIATQREWLHVVLRSIGDAVIATDEAGGISFMNSVAEQLTGWSGDDAKGRPFADVFKIVNEQTQEPGEDPCEKVLRLGHVIGLGNHTVLISKNGERRPIDDSAAPIVDPGGKVLGVVVVFRDATDERRAFEAMERLAAIVTNSDDAIIGKRLDGAIISWNAAAERLYGYREEEAIGQPISIIVPPDRRTELDAIMNRLRAGEPTEYFETVRQRKDGSLVDVFVTVSPIKNSYGEIVGASTIGRDITQQKRMHEAVRRSEQELHDFFENSAVGLHWVGPDGVILRANQAELDLLGYERDEYVGHEISEFHVDRPVIDDILERLKRGETLRSYEARMRQKDGTFKDVVIDSNVFWEEGRFVHSRCFTRDVTAQKQAEEALRASEERLRLALEAGRLGVWDWDIETGRLTWTENVYKIHGVDPGRFRGIVDDFRQLVHPEDAARVSEAIQRALDGESSYDIEFRILRPTGEVRWVLTSGRVGRDGSGRPVRMLGATIDITERKTAEENQNFLKAASDAVALLVDVESTMQQLAGLAVPYFADSAAVYLMNDRGQVEKVAQAHVGPGNESPEDDSAGRDRQDGEIPSPVARVLQTGEPELFDGSSSLVVPLDRWGRAVGAMSFSRWRSRERYSTGNVEVARELARRAATAIENRRLYDELKKADRQKDDFLAMLAHELRNPLAAIDYAIRLLDAAPEHTSSMAEVVKRQVGQLSRLIDDLLDVSRITRNKIQLQQETLDAATLVHRATATVRPLVDQQNHELTVKIADRDMSLFVDPTRAEQILANLLTNACKYTPKGGRISVEAFPEGDEVVISVKDSGIGIRQEMLPHIFELFTQVDSTIARTQGGLGIGLPVVRRLVEMHGGSVSATSEGPDQGSEFTVRLPLTETVASEDEDVTRAKSPALPPGLKILIVEDNQDTAASACLLFESLGCVTRQVHDGLAVLDAAKSFRPDVILLDIGLPGLDGYEAAQRLRRDRDLSKVKLYAVSGYGQTRDRERARDAGFDAHFTKPLKLELLLERLSDETRATEL